MNLHIKGIHRVSLFGALGPSGKVLVEGELGLFRCLLEFVANATHKLLVMLGQDIGVAVLHG